MKPAICVECKVNEARHWNSHLCESCFRKILKEDAKIKVKQPADVNVETAANKRF